MSVHRKQKHMIDFLFPILLFFVFTVSALTVILLAAGIYQSTTEKSSINYSARTSLSYITEKLHQNDSADSVTLGTFDDCEAIIMKHSHEDTEYYTYIYSYDNQLKELFISSDSVATAEDGRTILEVKEFDISPISDNMVKIQCTDKQQQKASAVIGLRCSELQ